MNKINVNNKENGTSKKRKRTLILLLLGVVLLGSSAYAYFSDVVIGSGTITAGTLDASGDYKIYVNGSSTPEASNTLTNFNPGDVVVIKANITNAGTKSAWIRDGIKLGGSLFETTFGDDNKSVLSVYSGEVAASDLATATKLAITKDTYYYKDAGIINGSVEKETNGVESYEAAFTLVFESGATNSAQNKQVNIELKSQALQYRNNTTKPSEDAWGTVVDSEFSLS